MSITHKEDWKADLLAFLRLGLMILGVHFPYSLLGINLRWFSD
jgi:hypothetical protein